MVTKEYYSVTLIVQKININQNPHRRDAYLHTRKNTFRL